MVLRFSELVAPTSESIGSLRDLQTPFSVFIRDSKSPGGRPRAFKKEKRAEIVYWSL